jgi:hypothetical protein
MKPMLFQNGFYWQKKTNEESLREKSLHLHTLGNSGWQEEPICMKPQPQPHADEIAGSRNPTILWQLHYTALH